MNLQCIESHTVDLDALPERPLVLDVGCRSFDFCQGLLRHRPYAAIVAMDPDPQLPLDNMPDGVLFLREALVGDERAEATYASHSTGEGNFLCGVKAFPQSRAPHYAQSVKVPCVSIEALMKRLDIQFWSLVKLDCEAAEFEILENWPGPIAGQLSVEFHDWTGEPKRFATAEYYERLFAGPLRYYEVLSHELSTVGPGPAWGHWDSVFRLRGEYAR